MAMQISGNYDYPRTDYAERVKEKHAERAEKTKEAEKYVVEKGAGRLSEPRDEYIPSEKSGKEPAGLRRMDGNNQGKPGLDHAGTDSISVEETADAVKIEPVIYTKTGEAVKILKSERK